MFLFVFDLCQVGILAATRSRSFVMLFQCLRPCVEIARSLKLAESSEHSTWFNVFLTVHHELTIHYQLDALIIIYS